MDFDVNDLSLMYYSCAPQDNGPSFQVFPSQEVKERAAVACTRTTREGAEDDICVTVLLTAEEEGAAYEEILNTTLERIITTSVNSSSRKRRYRQILSDSYRKIERRGGSRDQSLCPYMYERPIKTDELTSFCSCPSVLLMICEFFSILYCLTLA